jgi:hypothetical protein
MISRAPWERFGRILHRLSYLKLGFYLLGFCYQLQAMVFGSRASFGHNLCSCLLIYGLAMLMEGLRDNELVSAARHRRPNPRFALRQWVIIGAVVMFSLVVVQGLFFLYRIGDKFVGEAILTFGIGGLALLRLESDCLNYALVQRERQAVQSAVRIDDSPRPEQAPLPQVSSTAQE